MMSTLSSRLDGDTEPQHVVQSLTVATYSALKTSCVVIE